MARAKSSLEAVREITGPFCVDLDTEGGVAQSSHVGPMSCASISSVADLPHIFWSAMIERRPITKPLTHKGVYLRTASNMKWIRVERSSGGAGWNACSGPKRQASLTALREA